MKLEKINHDLFDISKRLKSIDRRYELFFNREKNRYEIYANGAMQMALPFERLDARALSYARKTRLENLEKIIAEIEEENARLEMEKASKARDKILAAAEGYYENQRRCRRVPRQNGTNRLFKRANAR